MTAGLGEEAGGPEYSNAAERAVDSKRNSAMPQYSMDRGVVNSFSLRRDAGGVEENLLTTRKKRRADRNSRMEFEKIAGGGSIYISSPPLGKGTPRCAEPEAGAWDRGEADGMDEGIGCKGRGGESR